MKTTKYTRLCSVAISFALCAASLAACGKGTASSGGAPGSGEASSPITGVDFYIISQPTLNEGDALDYALLGMEYSVQRADEAPGQYAEPVTGEHMPLTADILAAEPGVFVLAPIAGTTLAAGAQTITFAYTPPGAAGQTFTGSATLNVEAGSAASASSEVPEPASIAPPPQPAPDFVEGTPTVAVSGKNVTVTYKTTVHSTVNAIISTSGESLKTATFYGYFSRGNALEGAVSKKQTYSVTSSGKTETYELPDLAKSYYLLVNAVENGTGTWQSSVQVITLFDVATSGPAFNGAPVREADVDGKAVFKAETLMPSTVYALVTAKDAGAPTPQQIKESGSGYGSSIYATAVNKTNTDTAPYIMKIELATGGFTKGSYTLWLTAESAATPGAPLAAAARLDFTLGA